MWFIYIKLTEREEFSPTLYRVKLVCYSTSASLETTGLLLGLETTGLLLGLETTGLLLITSKVSLIEEILQLSLIFPTLSDN